MNQFLDNIEPGTFYNHEKLPTLILDDNKFTHLERDMFEDRLHSLRYFSFENNQIISIQPGTFDHVKSSLEYLNLQNNCLVHIDNGMFADLRNFGSLYLSNNTISTIEKGAFFKVGRSVVQPIFLLNAYRFILTWLGYIYSSNY